MPNGVMCPSDRVYVCDASSVFYRATGTITGLTKQGEVVVELEIGVRFQFHPQEIELDQRRARGKHSPPE